MITIEKISSFEEFLKLEPIWNLTLQKSEDNLVFLTFEFIRAEWEVLKEDTQLSIKFKNFVLIVKDGSEIIGIIPLVKYRTNFYGFPVTMIGPLGKFGMRRNVLIPSDRYEQTIEVVLKYLINNEKGWNIIEFSLVLKESKFVKYMEEGSRKIGALFSILHSQNSPYIEINEDWEEYLKNRSKNFHKKLKYTLGRLKKMGHFECREYHTIKEIEDILPVIFEIDLKSWKGKEGTAISSSEESKRFFTLLSKYFVNCNGISIWILWLNNIPIAFVYSLIHNNIGYPLKWSYDEDYHMVSPGLILLKASIEYFFKKNLNEIDLLGRADTFKLKWTNLTRQHCNVYILNKNIYSRLIYKTEFQFKPWIKKHFFTKKR